ncbi:MAG: winged helix-turn-helix transcriptional regulator [Rhodospirillales bacterium]|nr:winged helix-turn-helix transcriptional regulator [Rhodospirillales bacterium]
MISAGPMVNRLNSSFSETSDSEIVLRLLSAVENNSSLTQRSLAKDLGIALGLANAYLKRCAKKGFIKIQQVPANRYAYYLTPNGFSEKSRLTTEYLSQSFLVFRRAREEYSRLLSVCVSRGNNKIAVFGSSDLSEIILICARDFPVELVGIVTPGEMGSEYLGIPVKNSVVDLHEFDVILFAELVDPQSSYESLASVVGDHRVLAPEFLNISTDRIFKNSREDDE